MAHTPGSVINDPTVPPDLWTEQMLKAWKHAIDVSKSPRDKKLVNLDDLVEVTDHAVRLSSPRSLQACLHLGVDPSEVVYRPMDSFAERGMRREFQQIKYDHHETQRREKLQRLKVERERIMQKTEDDKSRAAAASEKRRKGGGDRDLLDRDRKRIEALRRRQQREMEQMAKFEAQRQQMAEENQARLEAERRAQERKKAEKLKKEKEWQEELRKKEIEKLKEEEALEKRSRAMAAERYAREQHQMQVEAERQKQIQRDAVRKEQERAQKQEEFRRQLERIQEAQQEVLRKRQEEMVKKDQERQRVMEQQNKERQAQNAEARRLAEERHQQVVENFAHQLAKRQSDYEHKQEELRIKLKMQEDRHKQQEAEKRRKEEMKEQQRQEVIKEAQAERDRRVQELLAKAHEADMILQNFIMQKKVANARRAVEHQLEFEDKTVRVENIRRVKALQRMQILQKIEAETDRVRRLLESRNQQQERHRAANVNLSIHRQSMNQQLERLSVSKKWRESLTEEGRADMEKAAASSSRGDLSAIGE